MRAGSVALVIASHLGLGQIVPGGLGVTVFFFVSGFLITRLALAEVNRSGRFSVRSFFLRRIFRLAPAFVVYLTLAVAFVGAVGRVDWTDVFASLAYLANYWEISGLYDRTILTTVTGTTFVLQSPFPILWSLAVEEHFYLVFPFVLVALKGDRRRLIWLAGGLCVAVLAWRCTLAVLDDASAIRLYMGTDTRIDSIAYGIVFAVLVDQYGSRAALAGPRLWLPVAAVASTVLLGCHLFRGFLPAEVFRYTVIGLMLGPILFFVLFASDPVTRHLLRHSWLAYVGRLSYSLYLYHYLAARLADYAVGLRGLALHGWLWMALFLPTTVILSVGSYHLVEQRFIGMRQRFGSHIGSSRSAPSGALAGR